MRLFQKPASQKKDDGHKKAAEKIKVLLRIK